MEDELQIGGKGQKGRPRRYVTEEVRRSQTLLCFPSEALG